MIKYIRGNIFSANAEALVNTVNCVGIMGKGIALQFKKNYPGNYKAYAAACETGEVKVGKVFVYDTGELVNPRYIINFPTKNHWRGKSKLEFIERGLDSLVAEIRTRNIRSVAIPPLGSGLGGLKWQDVKERITAKLNILTDVEILAYEPGNFPVHTVVDNKARNMSPGRAVLIELMDRYMRGVLDPFISLLEVHKLMYFMQYAGESLKLRYTKAPCGPFAENLRHVLLAVEGKYVSGYDDNGDNPQKPLQLMDNALKEATAFLEAYPKTRERFNRVADLVQGFESSFGLELLSTVHWVAVEEGRTGMDAIIEGTYAWNDRKRQFSSRQIGIAVDVLRTKGWIAGDGTFGAE